MEKFYELVEPVKVGDTTFSYMEESQMLHFMRVFYPNNFTDSQLLEEFKLEYKVGTLIDVS